MQRWSVVQQELMPELRLEVGLLTPRRDSTYVLDGLLYHESDLRIEEHYTDTAGFTDHVFVLMHLLGRRAPQPGARCILR
jgi:hypothetical protein